MYKDYELDFDNFEKCKSCDNCENYENCEYLNGSDFEYCEEICDDNNTLLSKINKYKDRCVTILFECGNSCKCVKGKVCKIGCDFVDLLIIVNHCSKKIVTIPIAKISKIVLVEHYYKTNKDSIKNKECKYYEPRKTKSPCDCEEIED